MEAKLPLQYTKFEMLSRDTFFHRLKQVVEEGLGSQHVEKIYIFYSFPDGSLNETKVKRKSGAFRRVATLHVQKSGCHNSCDSH